MYAQSLYLHGDLDKADFEVSNGFEIQNIPCYALKDKSKKLTLSA